MFQKRFSSLLILLPFTFSLACSGAGGADDVADAEGADTTLADAPQGKSSVIGVADVGYGLVTFHESVMPDGSIVGGVAEEKPSYVGETPIAQAFAEGHTTLEVFMALLPNQEPPQSLIDGHQVQTAAAGRTSEVQVPTIDLNLKVEKNLTQCKNHVLPASNAGRNYTYAGTLSSDDVYGVQSLTLPATTSNTTAGVCNEPTYPNGNTKSASHTVRGRVMYAPSGTSNWNNPGFTNPIAPGTSWVWHGLYVWDTCTPVPPSTICFPPNKKVSWRVEGKSDTGSTSNSYDLVIARISKVTVDF